MYPNGRSKQGRYHIKSILLLIVLSTFCSMACGSSAPSDTQVTRVLIQNFKQLEKASLGFTRATLKDIHIGDKRRVPEGKHTYEIEVTATVATRIGAMNAVRPCTTRIKLKKINNRWTLIN